MRSHNRKWNEKELETLKALLSKYKAVAVADLEGIPAPLIQMVRKELKGRAEVRVSKKRLIAKAIEDVYGKDVSDKMVRNSMALIMTNEKIPEIYRFFKEQKEE